MESLNKAIRRTLLKLGSAASLTDGQLLARFIACQEQAAFEELVRRHGPMVLRVCRRVLHHAQDAEDAFQATFIVLTRKAESIAKQESVASWLHGVAYRVALKARTIASQRHAQERLSAETMLEGHGQPQRPHEHTAPDICPVLDEEIKRLPEKYRAPIVLCYLEGKSNEEAARLLCCQTSALRMRLLRARDLLRSRLARRSQALSVGAMGTLLAQELASAAVPAALESSTVQAALQATSPQAAGASFRSVAALAASVLAEMSLARRKVVAVLLLCLVAGIGTASMIAHLHRESQPAGPADSASPADRAGPVARHTLAGHTRPVVSVRFSPDSAALATGSLDGTAKLWNAGDGSEKRTVHGHRHVAHCWFGPDGRTLVTVGEIAEAGKFWDAAAGTELGGFGQGAKDQRACSVLGLSPNGRWLATVSSDQCIRRWRVPSGQLHAVLSVEGLPRQPRQSALSPDGQILVMEGEDGSLALWSLPPWEATSGKARPLRSVKGDGRHHLYLRFSAEGRWLAAVRRDGTIQRWDVATGKKLPAVQLANFTEEALCMDASADGTWLAAGTRQGVLLLWHLRLWEPTLPQQSFRQQAHAEPVTCVALAPDAKGVATGSQDGTARIWQLNASGVLPAQ